MNSSRRPGGGERCAGELAVRPVGWQRGAGGEALGHGRSRIVRRSLISRDLLHTTENSTHAAQAFVQGADGWAADGSGLGTGREYVYVRRGSEAIVSPPPILAAAFPLAPKATDTMFKSKLIPVLCALPLVTVLHSCCISSSSCPVSQEAQTLCGDCGQVKGTDGCCDADAERCDCGKIKGSPGCCK